MSLGQAIWIGACQILSAVFPGTSRSMSTIAAGQLAGMSRASALEFSFFLSIPTMVAATGYDLLKSLRGKARIRSESRRSTPHGWVVLAIGFVVSFVVAYAFGRVVHGLGAEARVCRRSRSIALWWEFWCWCLRRSWRANHRVHCRAARPNSRGRCSHVVSSTAQFVLSAAIELCPPIGSAGLPERSRRDAGATRETNSILLAEFLHCRAARGSWHNY